MTESKNEPPPEERMNRLERRADVVRSRLFRAVDALDARRHQVERIGAQAKKIGEQARKLAVPVAVSVVGIAVLFGASAFMFSLGLKARRRRSLRLRAAEAIQRLDLVRQPALGRRVFDKVAITLVTFAVGELAQRASKRFVDRQLTERSSDLQEPTPHVARRDGMRARTETVMAGDVGPV